MGEMMFADQDLEMNVTNTKTQPDEPGTAQGGGTVMFSDDPDNTTTGKWFNPDSGNQSVGGGGEIMFAEGNSY